MAGFQNKNKVSFGIIFLSLLIFASACTKLPIDQNEDKICDYSDPNKKYVEMSKEICERIRYMCEPGMEPFSDECGCGCQLETESDEEMLDQSLEELDSISDL